MAVKIRLRRMGRKQHPVYALIAADARAPRDGRFIEDLGRYEPVAEPARVKLNAERIVYWLGQGAQPSDTARNLLQKEGILLRAALTRKGESAEAIEAAVADHQARRAEKAKATPTRAERRAEQLKAERAAAAEVAKAKAAERAEREAELQRQREEAEAAERAEREAARAAEAGEAATAEAEAAADEVAVVEGSATEVIEEAEAVVAEATEETAEPAAEVTESADVAPGAADDASPAEEPTAEEPAAEEAAAEAPATEETADVTESADVEAGAADGASPADETAAEESAAEEPVAETAEEAPAAEEASTEAAPAEAGGDDLTRIHGVGPKYAEILTGAGLTTFAAVAGASLDALRAAIEAAGSTTAGNEETWAEQAGLLAAGDDEGHAALVERLRAE